MSPVPRRNTGSPGAVTQATLTMDAGEAVTVDWFGLAAHNINSLDGGTINLEYSDNGTEWTLACGPVVPVTSRPVICVFAEESHRYWRIVFDQTAGTLRVGVAALGQRLVWPRGVRHPFAPPVDNLRAKRRPQLTEGGQYAGGVEDIRLAPLDAVRWIILAPAFVSGPWRLFAESARNFPFFIDTQEPNSQPVYAWMTEDPEVRWSRRGFQAVSFKAEGQAF